METNHSGLSRNLRVLLHGFMSIFLGVALMFSVLMVSRGFIFDWVTYFFLSLGTLTGLITFWLTDYKQLQATDH